MAPIVARMLPAVSGTSIRISPFIWATCLLTDLRTNPVLFLTPDTYTGVLLRRSARGTRLSAWAVEVMVPVGATPHVPCRVRLGTCSIEAAATDLVTVALAVGLSLPFGLLTLEGCVSECTSAVVLTLTPYSLLRGLDTGEFRGMPFRPYVLYTSARSPFFLAGSGDEQSALALATLTLLPAARCDLFAGGGGGFKHRDLGADCGLGAGRLVASSIYSARWLCACQRWLLGPCGRRKCLPRQSRVGARWADQSVLAEASAALVSQDSRRQHGKMGLDKGLFLLATDGVHRTTDRPQYRQCPVPV
jgi:hypothetical protein